MNIPTLALLITEENYPIAVACLPAGFAAGYSKSSVLEIDNFLVINKLGANEITLPDGEGRLLLTIENVWLHGKQFYEAYRYVDELVLQHGRLDEFHEVVPI